jgi:hypothetical protein
MIKRFFALFELFLMTLFPFPNLGRILRTKNHRWSSRMGPKIVNGGFNDYVHSCVEVINTEIMTTYNI